MDSIIIHTMRLGQLEATVTNLGCRIMKLCIGGTDVVQGFDQAEDYMPANHASDFGAVIGRYANRIAGGRLTIDGHTFQLPQNNGPNCLHGGPLGWQYALWRVEQASDTCIRLVLTSPDGDQGFPGEVQASVVYTLESPATLRIDFLATSDRPTAVNMTNHSYFNLSGDLSSNIGGHLLHIDSDLFTPTDSTAIPLASHAPVDGTPFDFRSIKPIGRDIEAGHPQLVIGHGYDHNFVLRNPGLDHACATLACPSSGIVMEVRTTAPGVQLYTGNFLDGVRGKGGSAYGRRSAVCLETQQYPDSPNRNWPESTGIVSPGKPLRSSTMLLFNTIR
ncbi:MAG: galactose mutarotase [Bacteroidales bacterium]|nr:galactose mutarotase [Bacteroidales bacterium]